MVVDAPTQGGDYRMLFFNSDGSVGEMCGNGARCICRYGYENGLAGETQTVETTAGIVTGQRIDQRLYRIRLNDPTTVKLDCPVEVDGDRYRLRLCGAGQSRHAPRGGALSRTCRTRTKTSCGSWAGPSAGTSAFPKGANVNFYELIGEDPIFERTFERGVEDFTYACGTGTGSVVTVLTLQGKVSGQGVRVDMTGGTLTIDAERDGWPDRTACTSPAPPTSSARARSPTRTSALTRACVQPAIRSAHQLI